MVLDSVDTTDRVEVISISVGDLSYTLMGSTGMELKAKNNVKVLILPKTSFSVPSLYLLVSQ